MKFETLGNKDNPVIVMLNGSFTTGKGLIPIAKPLSQSCYVILPTYDGHYENGGIFTDRSNQAKQIYQYLLDNGITEVAVIHGISMGAEVAMELIKIISDGGSIAFGKGYLDGGPFFHFPKAFYKLVMRRKFLGFVQPGKTKRRGDIERLLHSGIVKFMLGGSEEARAYLPMIEDMANASQFMTKQSVFNESDACYTFDPPCLPKETERRLIFTWSDNEPARKSSKRIKAAYPDAEYHHIGALGHCGFMVRQPERYINFIQELVQQ